MYMDCLLTTIIHTSWKVWLTPTTIIHTSWKVWLTPKSR
jgi:hypothetical protein